MCCSSLFVVVCWLLFVFVDCRCSLSVVCCFWLCCVDVCCALFVVSEFI